MKNKVLWKPTLAGIKDTNLYQFIEYINAKYKLSIKDYEALYSWSIAENLKFWESIWSFCKIKASKCWDSVFESHGSILNSSWFVGAELNFSENLLRFQGTEPAIISYIQDKKRGVISYSELYTVVGQVESSLLNLGIRSGDRIAAIVPNIPESVIAMLGSTALGAVWSSCSPDFGVQGALDRFGQILPRILFTADKYIFKDKVFDCLVKARELAERVPSIEHIVVIHTLEESLTDLQRPKELSWKELCVGHNAPIFNQLPFNHPLYIMYSSGTTGKPKCLVHGAGGTLVEHLKELILHTDLKRSDRIFYQTTCGWMMWNWLVSALSVGATIVLYDGYPLYNDGKVLIDIAQNEKVTIFGTNAKYIATIEKLGLKPKSSHDLTNLRTILSTGSPLLPESFDYVYESIKDDLILSSISGGTDILGCFALGSPVSPVRRGELQVRSLGLNVDVLDDSGRSITGQKGELVCKGAFPSMPIGFLNDSNKELFKNSYFHKYPEIWCHGDYAELTKSGGMIIYGRSDAVLNPGGIRIGTAEIYRLVDTISEISESVVISQRWREDERIILFVKLQPSTKLDQDLIERIKSQIRNNLSPHHIPKKIIAVPDIPKTISGKISELAVKAAVHGELVKNANSLANPESLSYFTNNNELNID